MNKDPSISEWGNPAVVTSGYTLCEATQGIETSQYLKEKKTIVIPKVVASEMGTAQTELDSGLQDCNTVLKRIAEWH